MEYGNLKLKKFRIFELLRFKIFKTQIKNNSHIRRKNMNMIVIMTIQNYFCN